MKPVLLLSCCLAALAGPSTVSVTPNAGTGGVQTFTATYMETGGAATLANVYILFNNTTNNQLNSCFMKYSPSEGVILLNDTGSGWYGPLVPGTSGTLQNGQCQFRAAASSVSGSPSSTLNVSFA